MKYLLAICGLAAALNVSGQTPQGSLFGGFE